MIDDETRQWLKNEGAKLRSSLHQLRHQRESAEINIRRHEGALWLIDRLEELHNEGSDKGAGTQDLGVLESVQPPPTKQGGKD